MRRFIIVYNCIMALLFIGSFIFFEMCYPLAIGCAIADLILAILANYIARKYGGYGIWQE